MLPWVRLNMAWHQGTTCEYKCLCQNGKFPWLLTGKRPTYWSRYGFLVVCLGFEERVQMISCLPNPQIMSPYVCRERGGESHSS